MMRTELHFHLLPGVDDGPRDEQEALELARLAIADGTRRVVATPHVRFLDVEALPALTADCQAMLAQAGLALELRAGGELSPEDVGSLDQRQLELLAQGPPGQRWLLLEAPLFPTETDVDTAAEELRGRGFEVLIGHPERSLLTPSSVIRRQVSRGAVLQINASSLTGGHGPEAHRASLALSRSGLPFLVSSDAHSPARAPQLTPATAALAAAGIDERTISNAVDLLPDVVLSEGLAAALTSPRVGHGVRSRLGQGERSAAPVARPAQVFLDRRRGS
jgi:protein-tyrosine phosphatase